MSLVGSLEDLGLGDILQIITLSRKSGALCLRSESGEGRVIFRDGLVCGARVKGRTPDLRGLLAGASALSDADFEALRSDAAERGVSLRSAVADKLTSERFERLRRECVERAVLDMFGWETGEFSFEVGEDSPEDELEVTLEGGINAQYLAMEGTRRTDEGQRGPAPDPGDVASFADLAEEMAEDDGSAVVERVPEAGPSDAFEAVALTTVEKVGDDDESPIATQRTEFAVEEALEAAIVGHDSEETAPVVRKAPAPTESGERPAVVVVDRQLSVLEWMKSTLEGAFPRVHIFQKADLAVQRLRQYVARGERPLVLVSPELPIDGACGWSDVNDMVARMKKQSPRSTVLWLGERSELGAADGHVLRPPDPSATSLSGSDPLSAESLTRALLAAIGASAPVAETASVPAPITLVEVVSRLSDPATRGEVLNVLLHFAGRQLQRVALFAVRDGEATGLAQLNLEAAGGPDDGGLREVRIPLTESNWLARLLETRSAVRGPARGDGDTRLSARLGELLPPEAWLGPVISAGQVVAFLYGDNLPGGEPLGSTEDLEAALVEAGRALDEAVAERASSAE